MSRIWESKEAWNEGYRAGFADGWDRRSLAGSSVSTRDEAFPYEKRQAVKRTRPRKSRRQSGKQKLLTDMAGKKWKAYKRNTPKGKKTYIDIRAQVSRSQAYKKKARRLK